MDKDTFEEKMFEHEFEYDEKGVFFYVSDTSFWIFWFQLTTFPSIIVPFKDVE